MAEGSMRLTALPWPVEPPADGMAVGPWSGRTSRGVSERLGRRDRLDRWTEADGHAEIVGREAVVALLEETIEACSRVPETRCVIVEGEAGSGKTRTLEECRRRAEGRGFEIVRGRCTRSAGAPPLWPFRQILRRLVAREIVRPEEVLDPGSPIFDLLDWEPRASMTDPARSFRLQTDFAEWVLAIASRSPLAFLIDDLHAADTASAELLGFLAAEVEVAPLLLVAASRDRALTANRELRHALGRFSERARKLSLTAISRTRSQPAGHVEPLPSGQFCQEGELWLLAFAGYSVRLRDAKGLHDISRLLARPHEALSAFELYAPGRAIPKPPREDMILDARARAAYRDRMRSLREEFDEAEARSDLGAIEKARTEIDFLQEELRSALGLGGRSRLHSGCAERARKAVSNRIRSSIARIGKCHPELSEHLAHAIETGRLCTYRPPVPVEWSVGGDSACDSPVSAPTGRCHRLRSNR